MNVNGAPRKIPAKPLPEIASPSWRSASPTGSVGAISVAPRAVEATSSPPSSASGTGQAVAGSTAATPASGVISLNAVAWAPSWSRARTVERTGTPVAASGGTTIVTGTVMEPPAGTVCGSAGTSTVQAVSLETASSVSDSSVGAVLVTSSVAGTRWASVTKPATSVADGVKASVTGSSVETTGVGSASPASLMRYGPFEVTRRYQGEAIARGCEVRSPVSGSGASRSSIRPSDRPIRDTSPSTSTAMVPSATSGGRANQSSSPRGARPDPSTMRSAGIG